MRQDLDRLMQERGLAGMVVFAHDRYSPAFYYATGQKIHVGMYLRAADGRAHLIHDPMERDQAAAVGCECSTFPQHRLNALIDREGHPARAFGTIMADACAALGMRGPVAFFGDLGAGFAYELLDRVTSANREIHVDRGHPDVLTLARTTKDADEVAMIRRSARGAVAAIERLRRHLGSLKREGEHFKNGAGPVTLGSLRRLLHEEFLVHGLEGGETIVSQGRDAGVPHNRGNDAELLRAGAPLLVDIFPGEAGGGYHSDLTRTFCLGEAPDPLKRLFGDVHDAFRLAMDQLRVGEACRSYQERVCDLFEKRGHTTPRTSETTQEGYVHGLGHGVGLAVHEAPRLGGPPSNTQVLEPGMVITVEPGLYYPSRDLGVRIEDLVLVRDDGSFENLTPAPYELEVKPGRVKPTHAIVNPPRAEGAVLVGHGGRNPATLERSLEELARLTDTAGARVLATVTQKRGTIHPATFIGKGKLEELKAQAEAADADMVIFDDDLSPAQMRNLEKALGRKVVDRSELILDIFARRARTRESRLQVELAQLEYTFPRLTGMWRHLERQAGGIGTRGPGETQLETDRRLVRERIARLKKELEAVERERETQRRRRRREFRSAIVGYTNAGKSTLFNALTRAKVFVEDRLFATLDATTRQLVSPTRQVVLLTDTVGFIRKLPHHLIASFHSTLVEAIEADLLLHVVDASDPHFRRQIAAVEEVLEEILETTRPTTLVFNKIDRIGDPTVVEGLRVEFPGSFAVSALDGEGLEALRDYLWAQAAERAVRRAS